jgi:hypothetical protein
MFPLFYYIYRYIWPHISIADCGNYTHGNTPRLSAPAPQLIKYGIRRVLNTMNVPSVPVTAAASSDNEFPTWVRNWIHYDTLTTNFSKQAANSRKVRDEYEERIITSLERRRMTAAVLQVNQGKYQVVKENHINGLTLGNLEKLLHQYYRGRGGSSAAGDETDAIMAFIKANRGHSVNSRLKKIGGTAPAPAPAPAPGSDK